MRRIILGILALGVAAGPLLAGVSDEAWKQAVKRFKDDFKKRSVKYKLRALEALPRDDARTIEFIIEKEKLLDSKQNWYVRQAAAERLSQIQRPELRKKIHEYATDRDEGVREGVMAALAMTRNRLDAPVIVKALDDEAWEVRRMACWAAGQQRVREAVPKMISMIHDVAPDGTVRQEGETHPRVRGILLFNLEEITGKIEFHTDTEQWKRYWARNKDRELPRVNRFDVGSFADVKLNFNDTFARKGTGHLVFVLPMQFKKATYLMPYLNQWTFAKWLYINLPNVESFPDVERDSDGDPIYPVDQLVEAFEEMRKKYGAENCVVLAHGFSNWIAAKYAQKYPDRVKGLILLNPYSSNEIFSKRVEEAIRSGDPDAEMWGKVARKIVIPATRYEREQTSYFRCTSYIKDQSDIEVAMLRKIWPDPSQHTSTGYVSIPPFDIRGEEKSRTPAVMFFSPKSSGMTGIDGYNRMKRYYTARGSFAVKLRKSSWLPFMEEPELFERAMRRFFDRIGPPE